ncbi:MAG: HU family DNA-binding protein, partial [Tatlockia sp.]|nr:HU family DNA-binding protein [Tatlockia sp.]MBA3537323.1 HU family DNA-binding protein [Tatlockia sp.]
MNKSELIDAIASGSGVTKADASRVLDTFMIT